LCFRIFFRRFLTTLDITYSFKLPVIYLIRSAIASREFRMSP